jgi:hypothetical protein
LAADTDEVIANFKVAIEVFLVSPSSLQQGTSFETALSDKTPSGWQRQRMRRQVKIAQVDCLRRKEVDERLDALLLVLSIGEGHRHG